MYWLKMNWKMGKKCAKNGNKNLLYGRHNASRYASYEKYEIMTSHSIDIQPLKVFSRLARVRFKILCLSVESRDKSSWANGSWIEISELKHWRFYMIWNVLAIPSCVVLIIICNFFADRMLHLSDVKKHILFAKKKQ